MMTKELRCRDLGFDCDAVVTADSEEILAQVADHGQVVHGLSAEALRDPDFLDVARNQIHEQGESH